MLRTVGTDQDLLSANLLLVDLHLPEMYRLTGLEVIEHL